MIAPLHKKAMPINMIKPTRIETSLEAPRNEAKALKRPLAVIDLWFCWPIDRGAVASMPGPRCVIMDANRDWRRPRCNPISW